MLINKIALLSFELFDQQGAVVCVVSLRCFAERIIISDEFLQLLVKFIQSSLHFILRTIICLQSPFTLALSELLPQGIVLCF